MRIRALAASGLAAAALTASLALPATAAEPSAPTSADVSTLSVEDCKNYLRNRNYRVGPGVTGACSLGSAGLFDACYEWLVGLGVNSWHATFACLLADD